MQILSNKKIWHLEDTENQARRTSVKEWVKTFQMPSTYRKVRQIESALHQIRLDLEIEMYRIGSKYQQFLHKKYQY